MPEYEAGTRIDLQASRSKYKSKTINDKSPTNTTAILKYPNKTTITLKGDQEIIKQLVDALVKVTVSYHVPINHVE